MNKGESYQQELRDSQVRQVHLDAIVKSAMARVVSQIAGRQLSVHSHFHGSSAIQPQHLVTWNLFRRDSEWEIAKHNGLTSEIEGATRTERVAGGYPPEGVNLMMVSFTSDEDIQRQTGRQRLGVLQVTY
jgi:hypothetical protein